MEQKRNDTILIRSARPEDAGALLALYRPYVEQTAITFEYEVPSIREFENRIRTTLQNYPYLLAEVNGAVAGYAYASAFKERKAYDWSVETSIYVAMEQRKTGVGKKLYAQLEHILKLQNIQNVNACIAYTAVEDPHLTNDSVYFHEHLGYRMVGTFTKCGYKFDTWYDMVWMEKMLGTHPDHPAEFIPYARLQQ